MHLFFCFGPVTALVKPGNITNLNGKIDKVNQTDIKASISDLYKTDVVPTLLSHRKDLVYSDVSRPGYNIVKADNKPIAVFFVAKQTKDYIVTNVLNENYAISVADESIEQQSGVAVIPNRKHRKEQRDCDW